MARLSQMAGKEILVYEMTGPLFFGTARQLGSILDQSAADPVVHSVVLIMDAVPVLDISGALALSAGVDKVLKTGKSVFLVGVRKQPLTLIRHHLPEGLKRLYVMDSMLALHEAVTRLHDMPTTPNLRWISQRDGMTALSPAVSFRNGIDFSPASRQQIQANLMI